MKKLFIVLAALLPVFTINAQNLNDLAVERQYPDNDKAVEIYQAAVDRQVNPATPASKITWLANKPANNWFISLAGGLAWLGSENYRDVDFKDNLKFTGGLAVGRWLNPVLGLRLDFTGAKLSTYMGGRDMFYIGQNHPNPNGKNTSQSYWQGDGSQYFYKLFLNDGKKYKNGFLCDFTYGAVSADLMVNLKNLFRPYNPDGFFNPVLYGGLGYSHTFVDGNRTAVNNILERFGLQFNFRLAKHVDIYLAAETMFVPENFDRIVGGDREQDQVISAKVGLTYHFGFNNFIKAPLGSQTIVEKQDQTQINALNNRINDLKARLDKCLATPAPAATPATTEVRPADLAPVFFELDKSIVRNSEIGNIEKAAGYLKNHPDAKLVLAGFADAKTGTHPHNFTLSENRVKAVADLLVRKYGIDSNRLILMPNGDRTQPFKINEHNRVVMFFK